MKVLYFKTSAFRILLKHFLVVNLLKRLILTIVHHHLLIEAHIEVQILTLCIGIHKLDNKLKRLAVITIKCPRL